MAQTFPISQQPSVAQQRKDRQDRMDKAMRYYLTQGVYAPLKVPSTGVDDNVLLALGRLIVDKGVAFLFGPDVLSKIEDEETTPGPGGKRVRRAPPKKTGAGAGAGAKPEGNPAAQLWLDLCWKRNKRMLTLQKLAMNGAICGHAFAKIVPAKPYPRVVVLDPRLVDVDVDPDDCDLVERFTVTTPSSDGDGLDEAARPERRQIIQTSGEEDDWGNPTSWTVLDQVRDQATWHTTQVATWDHPWPPIVHCQNLPRPNDFWGESDLSPDVIRLLDAINGATSRNHKIVRLWAGPKAWARGMGNTDAIDLSSDSVTLLPSETAELRTLEIKGDLSGARGHRDDLVDALSWVTRIPTVAMGKPDQGGKLSGVALALRYRPAIEKTEQKRRTYGDLVQDLDRHMLELGGFGADLQTQVVWPELIPTDPLEERQVFVMDDSLGVASLETIADALGYDYETESAQIALEKQAAADLALKLAPPVPPPGTVPAGTKPQSAGGGPASGGAAAKGNPVPPPAALVAPVPAIAPRPRTT